VDKDRIDELLERHETGKTFTEKNPTVSAFIDRQDKGKTLYQLPGFGIQKEYELRLSIRVNFIANNAQYKNQESLAIKQLKHGLYKDMISDIYEALNVCDDTQTKNILDRMLVKMGV